MAFNNCYAGKRVLVTGHTGFKGSWLALWLTRLGAEVSGFSRDIPTQPSMFESIELTQRISHYQGDIRDRARLDEVIAEVRPDFVFHLAAQAIVSTSYDEPVETVSTNVMGTTHVLEALRSMDRPCVGVIITSDKCYENVEWIWGYRENDRLGGKDPYSASKGAAELVFHFYVQSFFSKPDCNVRVASARAGNVIGGGDWAKDRIVADCMRAWSDGQVVEIRSPTSSRLGKNDCNRRFFSAISPEHNSS